jgi:hypothetical protein
MITKIIENKRFIRHLKSSSRVTEVKQGRVGMPADHVYTCTHSNSSAALAVAVFDPTSYCAFRVDR